VPTFLTPTSSKSVDKENWPNKISVPAAEDIRGPWIPFYIVVVGTNPALWPDHTSDIALAAEDLSFFLEEIWNGTHNRVNNAP
jgi:hypothetical protein